MGTSIALWALVLFARTSAGLTDDVFERYEQAFNRHDADAVAAFWALDTSTAEAKSKTAEVLRRWKGEREFERVAHAIFTIEARNLGGDVYEVTQREDCDLYRALRTGTKTSTFTVHLRDGQFHDVVGGPSTDSGRPYAKTLAAFKDWILTERTAQADIVLRDGDFVFDGRSARPLLDLATQWQAQLGVR